MELLFPKVLIESSKPQTLRKTSGKRLHNTKQMSVLVGSSFSLFTIPNHLCTVLKKMSTRFEFKKHFKANFYGSKTKASFSVAQMCIFGSDSFASHILISGKRTKNCHTTIALRPILSEPYGGVLKFEPPPPLCGLSN